MTSIIGILIVNYLKQYGRATKTQFRDLLLEKLPDSLKETLI